MLVFVYGSLQRGEEYHDYLQAASWLSDWTTPPRWDFWDLDNYPAAPPGGTHAVVGELYEVDQAMLERLDELELLLAMAVHRIEEAAETDHEGSLRSRSHGRAHRRVQHLAVTRSLLERIFGVGTIAAASAGTDAHEIVWRSVARPDAALASIRARVSLATSRHTRVRTASVAGTPCQRGSRLSWSTAGR